MLHGWTCFALRPGDRALCFTSGAYTRHLARLVTDGIGPDAAFGDSYSTLSGLGDVIDGRLRLTLGIPADAIAAAAERGMRTAAPLHRRRTMRFGCGAGCALTPAVASLVLSMRFED